MIDEAIFNAIEPDFIFASGIVPNSPAGIYMTDSNLNGLLQWIAIKHDSNEWAIYCGWYPKTFQYLADHGEKVMNAENILKLVPCTEEILKKYTDISMPTVTAKVKHISNKTKHEDKKHPKNH